MNARELLKKLKNYDIDVSLCDGDIEISYDYISNELLAEIKDNKQLLITFLKESIVNSYTINEIPKIENQDSYPLSSSQRRLWMLSHFENNAAYNLPGLYLFDGNLEVEKFNLAFYSLIERHEVLRTVFKEDKDGIIRQWVKSAGEFNLRVCQSDLRNVGDLKNYIDQYIEKEITADFDLSVGPLIRASLLHIDTNKYVFCYVMHHIISDGWSMGILVKELLILYNSYVNNVENPLEPLRIHYKDYAVWQQEQLDNENINSQRRYWLNQFSDDIQLLEMPTDYPRPLVKTYNGDTKKILVNKELASQFKTLTYESGGTLFMALLSTVNLLLYKYTNQTDITLGSTIAGREHLDLDNQIGFYVNTQALRTKFDSKETFVTLLNKVKQTTLGAYENQEYPFDELVDALNLKRDLSRNPLFDIIVVLLNTNMSNVNAELAFKDIKIEAYNSRIHLTSAFDLNFTFNELEEGFQLSLEYNSDLYKRSSIERLGNHFIQLISSIVSSPDVLIDELDYMSKLERDQLLYEFNDTYSDYPRDKTLIELFEAQVESTPGGIAIVFEGNELTYNELNKRSNQLGHYLRSAYEIKGDDLIGVQLERSEEMIIAILGILKSGGAYVPIDPDYPQERIDYIKEDSKCKVVIDLQELKKFQSEQATYSSDNLDSVNSSSDLAYIIYTSGSTGNPKGVMIEHRNLVSLLKSDRQIFDFTEKDVWTMFHSYCFDFSVWEMYGALVNGGKLVIIPSIVAKDPAAYLQILKQEGVTILNQTPSSFYNIIKEDQAGQSQELSLRYVIFGGEALNPSRLGPWKEKYPSTKLINMYGITETTIHVTYKEITETEIEEGVSNIGTSLPTLSCYIVNPTGNLLPIGVIGEIYVSGAGLCRGYLNKPELTKEKFITNPFKAGELIYKSGDIGRWLPDGTIEYIGRKDDQVKIRGYRIELGEIENVLSHHESVEEVVVIARSDEQGDKSLVCYLVSNVELNVQDLRNWLGDRLPSYMLPSYFVQLDKIPLTHNGKVDKKNLPPPEGSLILSKTEYVAPKTDLENKLVEIWSDVLGIEKDKIGIHDNFFDLGGNSIKIIQVLQKMNKIFNVQISVVLIFELTNIGKIVGYLMNSKGVEFVDFKNDVLDAINVMDDTMKILNQNEE